MANAVELSNFLTYTIELENNIASLFGELNTNGINGEQFMFAMNAFIDHYEQQIGRDSASSGGGDGSYIDFSEVLDSINNMYQGLGNYLFEMENRLMQRIESRSVYTAGVIQGQLQNQTGILTNQHQTTLGLINELLAKPSSGIGVTIEQINQIIQSSENNILGGVNALSNQVDSQLRYVQSNVIQNISNSEQAITNEIRNIQGSSGGIGGTGNDSGSTIHLAFYNAYLDLISQMLSAMTISGIKTTITNFDDLPDINVGGVGGSGGSGDIDSYGSIGDILSGIGNSFFGNPANYASLSSMYNKMIAGEYVNADEFLDDLNSIPAIGGIFGTILNIIQGVIIITTGLYKYSSPFTNNIETLARTVAKDGLLTPDIIITAWFRSLLNMDSVKNEFYKLGYDDQQIQTIVQSAQIPLREQYLQESLLKEIISRNEYDRGMLALGYKQDDLDTYVKLYENIPPYTDLIRFAVREAYDERAVERLDLDSEYDLIKDQFEKDMRAQGVFPPYPKYLWRSHWQLPSPTQAYEMLHRRIITEDELFNLLKASDYAPTWREKLMNISYSEYTRVDIRRMHDVGVLSDEDVYEAYRNIGYNDEKARNLQAFTLKLNEKENLIIERDLTQAKWEQAYRYNIIDKFKFAGEMNKLGYDDNEVNLLIELIDYGKQAQTKANVTDDNKRRIANGVSKSYIEGTLPRNRVESFLRNVGYTDSEVVEELTYLNIEREILLANTEIELIQKSFIEYHITESEVYNRMSGYGYESSEIARIVKLWDTVRENRNSHPTKAELKRWFDKDLIGDIELSDILKGMGYSDRTIELYFEDFYPDE